MTYLYLVSSKILSQDATSIRVLTFCKLLKKLGNEVIIISLDEVKMNTTHYHKDIPIISLRSSSHKTTAKALNFIMYRKRLASVIKKLNNNTHIKGVFFYDIPPHAIQYLKKWTKKQKVKLYHDSVEWYSPEQFKWGRLAWPYTLKNLLNRFFIDTSVSVIAISSYLYNFFIKKGINSTIIPVIMDIDKIPHAKQLQNDKLHILYAGSPGKKDYLKEMIEGLALLRNEERKKIEFCLLGITKQELITKCLISKKTLDICGSSIIAKGRVSRNVVLDHLKYANFTVLLRSPILRYAKAGFPTKVVESLATATPVICNITSDLGEYLKDGNNSLIVDFCEAKSFASTLQKALKLSFRERNILSENARKTAKENFDYRNFEEQFKIFINK